MWVHMNTKCVEIYYLIYVRYSFMPSQYYPNLFICFPYVYNL